MAEYQEGQTATRADGTKLVYQNGMWRGSGAPGGAQARPDYGQGAWQAETGDILTPGRNGPRVLRQTPAPADANMRGRLALGLGPMVDAQEHMADVEREGNPYSLEEHPGAAAGKALSDIHIPGFDGHPLEGLGKWIGGDHFQQYQQAASAFEAALMPIMSGSAVTPSEASRQIRASLPALGDDEQTLGRKAKVRRQMLNGAAVAMGKSLPYPDEATWGVTGQGPVKSAPAAHDPLGIRDH
jgi:hypothetical protein